MTMDRELCLGAGRTQIHEPKTGKESPPVHCALRLGNMANRQIACTYV